MNLNELKAELERKVIYNCEIKVIKDKTKEKIEYGWHKTLPKKVVYRSKVFKVVLEYIE